MIQSEKFKGNRTEMKFFRQLSTWEQDNIDFVIATIIDTGGSTPRQVGTQMAIRLRHQAVESIGTVGGGAFEKFVMTQAVDLLSQKSEKTREISIHLTQQLAMCCGGKMTAFLNKISSKPQIQIAGAGHVGTALAQLCQQLEYPTILIDERKEWADQHRFESRDYLTVICENIEEEWTIHPPSTQDFIVIATHDHAIDEKLLALLLPQKPRYIGMIGSQHKWLRFQKRLNALGIEQNLLNQVYCPIGLNIAAQTPSEIAVSILAQIISVYYTAVKG